MSVAFLVIWLALGLRGGVLLNRTDSIDPFAWPMAAALGPITLVLALGERRHRRRD